VYNTSSKMNETEEQCQQSCIKGICAPWQLCVTPAGIHVKNEPQLSKYVFFHFISLCPQRLWFTKLFALYSTARQAYTSFKINFLLQN